MIALLGGRRSIYSLPKTAVLDKCSGADVQGQLMSGRRRDRPLGTPAHYGHLMMIIQDATVVGSRR